MKDLSPDIANLSQLHVSAPGDRVFYNSATAFLQGLYPPTDSTERLGNGSEIEPPLGGYQYIPISEVKTPVLERSREKNIFNQNDTGCEAAEKSSNDYLSSNKSRSMSESSTDFFLDLQPVLSPWFKDEELNYYNAYAIFDLLNTAVIHNITLPYKQLLDDSTMTKLFLYASHQQWNLAYSADEKIRAIAGSILARHIVMDLERIVEGKDSARLMNVQFGTYSTFMSFFGLAKLHTIDVRFKDICEYASSMVFELITNANKPKPEDISVRFLFSDGSAAENELKTWRLFGRRRSEVIPWYEFRDSMKDIFIRSGDHFDDICKLSNNDTDSHIVDSDGVPSTVRPKLEVLKVVCGVYGAMAALGLVAFLYVARKLYRRVRGTPKSSRQEAPGVTHGMTDGATDGATEP